MEQILEITNCSFFFYFFLFFKKALFFTDLVERSHSDGHFDTVLAMHVRDFGPHAAAGRCLSWDTGRSAAPWQRTRLDCVELHDNSNTAAGKQTHIQPSIQLAIIFLDQLSESG